MLEARLVIAYSLIGVLAVASLIGAVIVLRQRARRKRRMRGHKADEVARQRRGRAV